MIQDKDRKREVIVKRVAQELKDGDLVNLGIGMPTLVANYIPEGIDKLLNFENGLQGLRCYPKPMQPIPTSRTTSITSDI